MLHYTGRLLAAASLVLVVSHARVDAADVRLVEAVKRLDHRLVQALLAQHVDPNATAPDGTSPLHWAALRSDLAITNLLLNARAQVDSQNAFGVTPLSLACTGGNPQVVERLLQAGANPNLAQPTGETPLMTAARTGIVAVVRALLDHGANVRAADNVTGQTALMWAVAEGHVETARLLMASGADVHGRTRAGYTPLSFAAQRGDEPMGRALFEAGARADDAATDGTTPLIVASIRGHLSFAGLLLDRGADPNRGPGFTPLHWAAGEWDTDLTVLVPDDTEWGPLGGTRGPAKLAFVRQLLAHGANPNARVTQNPPRYGRRYGTGGGGDLRGATPFLLAAAAGAPDVMRLLVASGADPTLTLGDGTTPLMMAAGLSKKQGGSRVTEQGALEAVMLCVEHGADVTAVNKGGETALHAAAYSGQDSIVRLLVTGNGAKVNVKNRRGWTPLAIAEGVNLGGGKNSFPGTAELLRQLGAEPSPPDLQR